MAEKRARNWTLILYPGECNPNYFEVLGNLQVPCAISPTHTPEDEKAHRHVIICGEKKSQEQIMDAVCGLLGEETANEKGTRVFKGVSRPEPVISLRSSVRYLVHFDDKEKQQWENPIEQIKAFGGFDVLKYFEDKKETRYQTMCDLLDALKEIEIADFSELVYFCRQSGNQRWFEVVADNAYFFSQFVRKVYKKPVDKLGLMAVL